jgi:hypothetical protein
MNKLYSVLEHKTNGERSLILWDCEIIRDNTALHCGLVWIDKSSNFERVTLVPRMEESPIIVIEYPKSLRGLATGQTIADVIFKIESIT